MWERRSKYHLEQAIIGPLKLRFTCVPMMAQHCMLAWQLLIFFLGDPNQYCLETLHFCDFSGGERSKRPSPLWIRACVRLFSERYARVLKYYRQ